MDPKPSLDQKTPDHPRPSTEIPLPRDEKSRRGCWGRLLFFFIGLLVILAAAEAAIRILDPAPPLLGRFDPILGESLRPGARGWWQGRRPVYVRINSLGHRDRERGWQKDAAGKWIKPAGTRRILLLGNGLVAALGVDLKQTFGQILERDLMAAGDWRRFNWEVINAGLPDAGLTHQYLLLKDRGFLYRPDIVISLVNPPASFLEDSPEFGRTERPHVRLEAGRLEVDPGFKKSGLNRLRRSWWGQFLYWIAPECHILRWLSHQKFRILGLYELLFGSGSSRGPLDTLPEVGRGAAANSLYLNLTPFTWACWQYAQMPLDYLRHLAFAERVRRITAKILIEMNRMCRDRGVKFLVVLVPRPERVDRTLRAGWHETNPALVLNLVEDRIKAACRAGAIPLLSLTNGIIRLTKDRGAGLWRAGTGDDPEAGGLNERGQAVVARLLLEYLIAHHRDWIRPPK
jgi:hypothetical protein